VPAAAVIPALKMHRTIAAVKKLVVGSLPSGKSLRSRGVVLVPPSAIAELGDVSPSWGCIACLAVYFEQIRVLSTGVSPECSCME
jgi:hypothetical protein